MKKHAIEQTGIIPRSIIRTFNRFRKQLLPGADKLVIQEYRISRSQVLVSIKCLLMLTLIPLLINYFLKTFLLLPITEHFWNRQQSEIFLNSYQQNRAFAEIKKFEEKTYFEFLINDKNLNTPFNSVSSDHYSINTQSITFIPQPLILEVQPKEKIKNIFLQNNSQTQNLFNITNNDRNNHFDKAINTLFNNQITNVKENDSYFFELELKKKIIELAISYNQESILALTNLIGDFITFGILSLLIIWMKPQIIILKSFLTESIYSLSDTTKSFLLILGTDLLVGFHSPRGWEVCLELVLKHFGFPENQDFIYLFVATFPVLLDTVFKYWIFRYLNQISPSTVVTYHSMIE